MIIFAFLFILLFFLIPISSFLLFLISILTTVLSDLPQVSVTFDPRQSTFKLSVCLNF